MAVPGFHEGDATRGETGVGGGEGEAGHPWTFERVVRGHPAEIEQMLADLTAALVEAGCQTVAHQAESADQAFRARTVFHCDGDELALAVAPSLPTSANLPYQHQIVSLGVTSFELGERLSRLLARIPFTPLELADIRTDMPLTTGVVQHFRRWLGITEGEVPDRPLAGYAAVFTIHHQTDFFVLLERALELGIDPNLATVIDKEYRYRHSERVDASIEKLLGVKVFRYGQLKEGISDHIRRVASATRVEGGRSSWPKTIVLDDGGYIYPCLKESFSPYLSFFAGIVEQTASGIWALKPFDPLQVPIFSVAESDLKSTVEAQGVAAAAITNLRVLLKEEKFDGKTAVVVGYGRVGQALVEVLRRANMIVVVVESERAERARARERGLEVMTTAEEAIRDYSPRFVFSCAGKHAVGEAAFGAITRPTVLVSLTSRDFAFDKDALKAAFPADPYGTIGTMYRISADPPIDMLLLADGYPVNFHYAESMPNQQSDIVMASLLVGAIHLCTAIPPWPSGNDSQRANSVLNTGGLLDDFLAG